MLVFSNFVCYFGKLAKRPTTSLGAIQTSFLIYFLSLFSQLLFFLALLYEDMVWCIKKKNLRRPVVLVSAACTSMLVGVLMFDKLLSQSVHNSLPTRRFSSCNISKSPSYAKLQKYEASRSIKGSVRFDVVFLGSNSPIEDRFVIGASENLNAALFSVIDGHKGTHCSQHLQEKINQHVSQILHGKLGLKDDLKTIMDMDSNFDFKASNGKEKHNLVLDASPHSTTASLTADMLKECLRDSFMSLDKEMSEIALKEVERIQSGHSLMGDMRSKILTALEGACALTALVGKDSVTIASTGDCRVVLGHNSGQQNKWEAYALTIDQNAHNAEEVKRLQSAHPGEEDSLIVAERVLGSLMPFRTFGDMDYKWKKKHVKLLVPLLPGYKTPPYITAEPVLSQHHFIKGDQFLILASDGLWERMSNQEAVNIVGRVISRSCDNQKLPYVRSFLQSKVEVSSCCDENAATSLLWHALGGTESIVSDMLKLKPHVSRLYRDDITIMVVYL